MTSTDLDRRLSKLEERIFDVEQSHGASIYRLSRDVRRHELTSRRLLVQGNALARGMTMMNSAVGRVAAASSELSRGMATMMELMGLTPITATEITVPEIVIEEVAIPTEEEVDASFEEEF